LHILTSQQNSPVLTWNQNNPQQRITVDMADITRRVQNMRKTKSQRIIETAPKAMRAQMRRDAAAARD
jgi:Xaa-Pro aminopeptidase